MSPFEKLHELHVLLRSAAFPMGAPKLSDNDKHFSRLLQCPFLLIMSFILLNEDSTCGSVNERQAFTVIVNLNAFRQAFVLPKFSIISLLSSVFIPFKSDGFINIEFCVEK